MKFNEKLIKLRKKEGISQEELGEQLSVTRQTVSKWELGQTSPEIEKVKEIGRIFDVDLNVLLDETIDLEYTNEKIIQSNIEKSSEVKKLKEQHISKIIAILLVIIIIILISLIVIVICKEENSINNENQDRYTSEYLDHNVATDIYTNYEQEKDEQISTNKEDTNYKSGVLNNSFSNIEKDAFNNSFNMYTGTAVGYLVNSVIDLVINNNQTNTRKVAINYLDITTQDIEEFKNIKKKINESQKYNIYYEYDKYGYIYLMKIERN